MKKFEISCNMSLDAMEVQSHNLLVINSLLVCSFACQVLCNSLNILL